MDTPNEGGRWERSATTGKLTRTEEAYTDEGVDPSTGKPLPGTDAAAEQERQRSTAAPDPKEQPESDDPQAD